MVLLMKVSWVRISYGGAQEKFGVTPDLTTLGKVIGEAGCGLRGKKEIM